MTVTITVGKWQSILDRLANLEASDQKTRDDLLRTRDNLLSLEKDNISLQRDVLKVQKENRQINEQLQAFQHNLNRIEKLIRVTKMSVDKIQRNEKKTEERISQINELKRVMNRALVQGHSNNQWEKQSFQSEALIEYDGPKLSLTTGKFIKMDKLVLPLSTSLGCFHVASCELQPEVDGFYLANVVFEQRGRGKIHLSINSDTGNFISLGKSDHNQRESAKTLVIKLSSRSRVWLEACREEGEATIEWCDMFIRLLS